MVLRMEETDFFSKFSRFFWWGALMLALLAGLIFFMDRKSNEKKKLATFDYQQATKLVAELTSATHPTEASTLATIDEILKRHPELHPTLDGPITLALFANSEGVHASSFANSIFLRTENLPIHHNIREFSEISILIEKGEREAAIERALALEGTLATNNEFQRLRAYNLFRLALLKNDPTLIEQARKLTECEPLFSKAPDLSNWIYEKYGTVPTGTNPPVPPGVANYGRGFYTNLFELILRLKGNYLWPAMWNNAFNEDDHENPVLADEYGIVMGTSHQEPMLRAQKEWDRRYQKTLGSWNYAKEPDVLQTFWREGIRREQNV